MLISHSVNTFIMTSSDWKSSKCEYLNNVWYSTAMFRIFKISFQQCFFLFNKRFNPKPTFCSMLHSKETYFNFDSRSTLNLHKQHKKWLWCHIPYHDNEETLFAHITDQWKCTLLWTKLKIIKHVILCSKVFMKELFFLNR